MTDKVALRLAQLLDAPEDEMNLAEAALVIAGHAYPDLDVKRYLEQLDHTGERLKQRLPADASLTHVVRLLNHYFFQELGFGGDGESYYDPRNSLLNDVLERRLGIPITLSILYMEIGRRVGLELHGVSFPGHFLVKCPMDQGVLMLDPYHGGLSLSERDLRRRLAQLPDHAGDPDEGDPAEDEDMAELHAHLQSATRREIIARLLRNLKKIYLDAEEWDRALRVINLLLVTEPDSPAELRDRGLLYRRLECFHSALHDLERYVTLTPGLDDDEDDVRVALIDLRQRREPLH